MKNREILFRGINKNGKWHYGDLVHDAFDGTSKNIPIGIREKIDGTYSYPIEVIPETVGQFTGLHDVKGKCIFVGDMVVFLAKTCNSLYAGYCQKPYIKGQKFVVTNLDSGFSLTIPEVANSRIPNQVGHVDNYTLWNHQGSLEIIGTIHDHLLEANNE